MMRNNLPSLGETGFGLDPGCKMTLHCLVALLLCLWLVPAAFAYPQKTTDAQRGTSSIVGSVAVNTGEGQVNNLAGITVKLIDPKTGSALQSTLADESGHFQFTQLVAGTYTLEVSAEGFKAWVKTITMGQSQATAEDVTLEINSVEEKIEVQAENIEISTHSAEATGTLSGQDLDTLPLAQQKSTEALPLTPGVIRTPEGKLNFNGQPENQGILLMNSTETVDPVTGSFAIPVPVDVIQSMSVHTTPDTAEFGGFSGGLTEIETKPPFDAWNYKLHDFIPGIRGKGGHLQGIADFTPRLEFGGPLIDRKFNFTEELTYDVTNQPVRGLSWPVNEIQTRSVTSFTESQVVLSPRHLLDVNLNVFPLRRRFANINTLVPQTASSDYGQK